MDRVTPSPVIKGKRTKRPRPPAAAPASSISSAELSTTTTTTEEEEDMANCLILLAQGRALDEEAAPATERLSSRRPVEAAASVLDVYQCKTCNKCFPSFQALGGHCTSHKKPKTAASAAFDDGNKPPASADSSSVSRPDLAASNNHNAAKTTAGSSRPRVHECSICGSEFSSGQALGGHMRRHRPVAAATADRAPPPNPLVNKQKHLLLSLDLNLPAQSEEDEYQELPKSPSAAAGAMAFPFQNRPPPPLVFSVSSLVDCHY